MSLKSIESGEAEPLPALLKPAPKVGVGAILTKRLGADERKALKRCEQIIIKGAAEFVRVGLALKEIRDCRLYRETHSTFEAYCLSKFDFRRANGTGLSKRQPP